MGNAPRMLSFYCALSFSAFIPATLLAAPLIVILLPGSPDDRYFLTIAILLTLTLVALYSYPLKAHLAWTWANPALSKGSSRLMIGHLGIAYMALAAFMMINGGAASGIALIPGIAWCLVFYIGGLARIRLVLKPPAGA